MMCCVILLVNHPQVGSEKQAAHPTLRVQGIANVVNISRKQQQSRENNCVVE